MDETSPKIYRIGCNLYSEDESKMLYINSNPTVKHTKKKRPYGRFPTRSLHLYVPIVQEDNQRLEKSY